MFLNPNISSHVILPFAILSHSSGGDPKLSINDSLKLSPWIKYCPVPSAHSIAGPCNECSCLVTSSLLTLVGKVQTNTQSSYNDIVHIPLSNNLLNVTHSSGNPLSLPIIPALTKKSSNA